ncbi:MAG TPA: M20/M25/M40 family metallo-hydrolase [Pyrinomonadaceae bacterium]|nr:M20/M25/M40 family metallo-hydrolase [Pyrinomonadaceae bacterium]
MRHKFSALHRFSALLLVLALTAGAFAQQQQQSATVEVSGERLRAHVAHLASDRLEGRRTGTQGASLAAQYIAEEFKRLGLKPGARTTGQPSPDSFSAYMQKFPYVAAVELGKRNSMSFHPRAGGAAADDPALKLDLRLGEDWTPLAWSAGGRVERSTVVYVGYGIKASELGHDDYAGVDSRGKIALAFAGTPDGDNPHGQFARFGDLRFKAAAAREAGARALLVITREQNFKDDRLTRLRPEEGLAAGDAGLPVVLISRQVARRAVEAASIPSVTFEKLEESAGAKPEAKPEGGTPGEAAQQPDKRNHSTPLRNIAFSLETDIVKREAPAYNVVGILEGSDPKLKDEAIVIGAHYDHLGRGGQGSLAQREGEIHHGADDNASGTAAVLELARVFSASRPRRTVVFAAFGGEEEGLLGSNFYVNRQPAVPLAQTVAMFNMDMVGRMKEDRLVVGGAGTAAEWRRIIERENATLNVRTHPAGLSGAARREGDVPIVVAANGAIVATATPAARFALTLNDDGFGPSDHSSFYARQIPVLFFWTGTHEDYHKPTDTAERINYEGLLRVTEFVRDIVRAVDAADARPTYTQAKSATPAGRAAGGFRVYLGTIPSYAEGGDGMKLDGVRDDSPAAKAGLKAGDLIVKLAGRDVKNVYDYTQVLGYMKAGEEYEVEVLRGGERLKFKLTPAARK